MNNDNLYAFLRWISSRRRIDTGATVQAYLVSTFTLSEASVEVATLDHIFCFASVRLVLMSLRAYIMVCSVIAGLEAL